MKDVSEHDIVGLVCRDFREAFGVMHFNPYNNECSIGHPPPPGNQLEFLRKTASISARYVPRTMMRNLRSLDSYEGLENKLLFADGQVNDFASHTLRRVQPTDRLARRCPIPYPDWGGPPT